MAASSKKSATKYYIHSAIGLAIMLFFGFLPVFGSITTVGMRVLGIFIGLIYLWITVDSIWPSVIALLLIAFSGFVENNSITATFNKVFGNNTVITTAAFMMILSPIAEIGLADKIAIRMLRIKLLKGRPYALIFTVSFVSYLLAAMAAVPTALFVMWPVCAKIGEKCGFHKGEKLWYSLMCSVFMGAMIGQPVLPVFGMVATLLSTIASTMPDSAVNVALWIPYNFIMAIVACIGYNLVIRFIIRPDAEPLKNYDDNTVEGDTKLNGIQKMFLGFVIALILVVVLPAISSSFTFVSKLGTTGLSAILIAICIIPRKKDGTPAYTFSKYVAKTFNWGLLFMVAAIVYMGNVIMDDSLGIKATLVAYMEPLFGGMSATVFVIIVVIATILLTQVVNNLTAGIIMITIVSILSAVIPGLNATAVCVVIILSVATASLLPSGSPYASFMHSSTEYLDTRDIMTVFVPTTVMIMIVYCAVAYPLALLIF